MVGFYCGLLIYQVGIKEQFSWEKGNICVYAEFLTFPDFVLLFMTTAKGNGSLFVHKANSLFEKGSRDGVLTLIYTKPWKVRGTILTIWRNMYVCALFTNKCIKWEKSCKYILDSSGKGVRILRVLLISEDQYAFFIAVCWSERDVLIACSLCVWIVSHVAMSFGPNSAIFWVTLNILLRSLGSISLHWSTNTSAYS